MKNNYKTMNIVHISLFVVLLSICSYISIPFIIPFTLQTFGVFLTCLLLGGKKGTMSIIIWIFLGLCGAPVFSNFKNGIAAILSPTGGYILGFIFTSLTMWLFEKINHNKLLYTIISMFIGLILCYTIGTIWFVIIYTNTNEPITIYKALTICVTPFIIFDILKMVLALIISKNKNINYFVKNNL